MSVTRSGMRVGTAGVTLIVLGGGLARVAHADEPHSSVQTSIDADPAVAGSVYALELPVRHDGSTNHDGTRDVSGVPAMSRTPSPSL